MKASYHTLVFDIYILMMFVCVVPSQTTFCFSGRTSPDAAVASRTVALCVVTHL
jgi:hypothetical protein